MMNPPATPPTLDHFEAGLLQELRAHVATRSPEAVVEPEAHRSHKRRWAAGLAVAAAAATAFVVASPGGPATSPAYAVDEDSDGDVVVKVHRLEDSDGLEKALAEHGIDAVVSFEPGAVKIGDKVTFTVPDDATPAPEAELGGGGQDEQGTLDAPSSGVNRAEPAPDGEATYDAACGSAGDNRATLRHDGDDWVLAIPAESPLHDRPVTISTGSGGELGVFYEGAEPGSYCGVMSVGA